MHVRRLLLPVALSVALTGCGGTAGTADNAPQAGTNRPSGSPSAAPEPEPSPSPAEDKPLAFGQAFTYTDKLGVSVSAPAPYKPTETSSGAEEFPTSVVFTVTLVNGTGKRFDPALFNTTLQSDNQESSQVFDSAAKLDGAPSTTLLPGREAKFRLAFNVANPKDLVLEVTPDFEHEAVIFTTTP